MTTIGNATAAGTSGAAQQTSGGAMSADIQPGKLKSAMPLSEAWAPQFLVKGDLNGDSQLSQDEFVDLLGKAAVEKDKALALFKEFGGTEKQGITVDQFFEGIKDSNARGDTAFSQMTQSLLYGKQGALDASGLQDFLRAGASFAEQFWQRHR